MLARASLGKESSSQAKAAPASKPDIQSASQEQESPIEEFTPPKFAWSISNIAMSAPRGIDPPSENNGRRSPSIRMSALSWPLQAKLEIGEVNDPLEHEADRVAEQVMRMPDPASPVVVSRREAPSDEASGVPTQASSLALRRKCSCGGTCDKCKAEQADDEHGKVQRKPAIPDTSNLGTSPVSSGMSAPPIVHEVLRSPGEPLGVATRAFMEPRFGRDFSYVRVHTDRLAAGSAAALGANAYTVGHHVAFREGVFSPASEAGRRLLAHELAHTVQQSQGYNQPSGHVQGREGQTDGTGGQLVAGRDVQKLTSSSLVVARQPSGKTGSSKDPIEEAIKAIDLQIELWKGQLQLPGLPSPVVVTIANRLSELYVQRHLLADHEDQPVPSQVPQRPTTLSLPGGSCPSGAMPYRGVCLTDEMLGIDFDAQEAEKERTEEEKRQKATADTYLSLVKLRKLLLEHTGLLVQGIRSTIERDIEPMGWRILQHYGCDLWKKTNSKQEEYRDCIIQAINKYEDKVLGRVGQTYATETDVKAEQERWRREHDPRNEGQEITFAGGIARRIGQVFTSDEKKLAGWSGTANAAGGTIGTLALARGQRYEPPAPSRDESAFIEPRPPEPTAKSGPTTPSTEPMKAPPALPPKPIQVPGGAQGASPTSPKAPLPGRNATLPVQSYAEGEFKSEYARKPEFRDSERTANKSFAALKPQTQEHFKQDPGGSNLLSTKPDLFIAQVPDPGGSPVAGEVKTPSLDTLGEKVYKDWAIQLARRDSAIAKSNPKWSGRHWGIVDLRGTQAEVDLPALAKRIKEGVRKAGTIGNKPGPTFEKMFFILDRTIVEMPD